MDLNSTLLIVILGVLSVNVLFVGIYIVLVLREVRNSISKLNRIIETVDGVVSSVAAPILGASAAVTALTKSSKLLKFLDTFKAADELLSSTTEYSLAITVNHEPSRV